MGVAEVVGVASTIITVLVGWVLKLYRDCAAERARADALSERLNREHKRDLRHVAGLPTSLQPSQPSQSFESHTLFGLPPRDDDDPPPSTERPPPRKPPRPR